MSAENPNSVFLKIAFTQQESERMKNAAAFVGASIDEFVAAAVVEKIQRTNVEQHGIGDKIWSSFELQAPPQSQLDISKH